jgi:hypothetical protein
MERTLTERIGDAGKSPHGAQPQRSVATAFRLWAKFHLLFRADELALIRALVRRPSGGGWSCRVHASARGQPPFAHHPAREMSRP